MLARIMSNLNISLNVIPGGVAEGLLHTTQQRRQTQTLQHKSMMKALTMIWRFTGCYCLGGFSYNPILYPQDTGYLYISTPLF